MTAVALFVRAPRLGEVKTRLAQEIGAEAALAVYRSVGARVAARVAERYPVTVWYDPPGGRAEVEAWLGGHAYRAQPPGDLGRRLDAAVAWHWACGEGPVVAIGADVPGITAETVREAERALGAADVVVGPALDGGYYLIGLERPAPTLFRNVAWGTGRVLAQTLEAAGAAGLAVRLLPELRDVDTAADVRALGLDHP